MEIFVPVYQDVVKNQSVAFQFYIRSKVYDTLLGFKIELNEFPIFENHLLDKC